MAYITYIEKFKKGNDEYNIKAASAETAIVADRAITADTVDNAERIGNVRKYSTIPTVDDDKYREGLRIENTHGKDGLVQGIIELNNKGNLAVESLDNHVNIEAKKQIKMKPTTKMILDSSRKVEAGKGNEFEIEAVNDDLATDNQEKWSELKIKSRNIDLRCNNHGGIALQIAGEDGDGNENKIKFESDRKNSISEVGTYNGEGGKGLEFGTFNNLHSSLYTGDYRFNGNGMVYGASREAPVQTETGKWDYPTQSDDFKDLITETTKRATWNQIIEAANKCNGKGEIASIQDVSGMIAEASIPDYTGTTEHLATQEYVQNYVNEHGGGSSYEAGNGIHIEDNTISVNNYSSIEPLTALTDNVVALNDIKIGKSKGNFAVDVTGKYTYELTPPKSATTRDEHEIVRSKGERILTWDNEAFYANEYKVYYTAVVEAELDDSQNASEPAAVDTIVWVSDCELTFDENCGYDHYEIGHDKMSFYEDENKYVYKGTKNVSIEYGQTEPIKKKKVLDPATLSENELAYYDSQVAVYDEDDNLISGWEKSPVWKKSTLWSVNEININLETDSKIKFAGNKIEAVWTVDDVDRKMEDILLSTNTLSVDANEAVFEQKISKNGDREGQDTVFAYTFTNNVADTEKVADVNEFMTNYRKKHSGTYTDEELTEMYNSFLAEGTSYEVRVTISELLGLVARVRSLEERVAALENPSNGE